MAFSPDGNLLASGDAKGCLSIWDLAEGKRVGSMPAHRAPLWSLSFSSGEGNMLASGTAIYVQGSWWWGAGEEMLEPEQRACVGPGLGWMGACVEEMEAD